MRTEYETKPQAKLCYDFTVCGISVKGSAMVDTFKKAHDQCAKLNKRYGLESHWVEPADKSAIPTHPKDKFLRFKAPIAPIP